MSGIHITIIWFCTLLGYALSRAAEVRVHARNYRRLMAAGAEERAPGLLRAYYMLHIAVIPLALLEQIWLRPAIGRNLMLTSLMLILVGQALRLWVIQSLGTQWTMRCLVLPGLRASRHGPYRLIDNPEYLSRIVDGLGLCLVFGARLTLVLYLGLLLVFNRKLGRLEQAQRIESEADASRHRQALGG